MSRPSSRPSSAGTVTAVTVHGPGGVLDLTVPAGATLADVARVYAAEAHLPAPLPLVTPTGAPLRMTDRVGAAGLQPGALLVAVEPADRAAPRRTATATGRRDPGLVPGTGPAAWLCAAVAAALLAGLCTASLPEDERWPGVVVLGLAALAGCLPYGARAAQRVVAAPAFAAAATLAVLWDPHPGRLPVVLGAVGLAAAVTASTSGWWPARPPS
ncbi:hypothetical protein L615_005100000010, partial [Nocardioides sp. J9]